MKKILLIQFRMDHTQEHEVTCFYQIMENGELAEMDVVSIFNDSLPWNRPEALFSGYDGVIFGGSGELFLGARTEIEEKALRNAAPLLEYAVEHDIPTLSICFGHQLLGEVLGSPVIRSLEHAKLGTFATSLLDHAVRDPIFTGMPQTFLAQYAHKDSVSTLPKNAIPLTNAERTSVDSFKIGDNVYSFQFHPELSRDAIDHRLRLSPAYSVDSGKDADMFRGDIKETPDAPMIIHNFIRQIMNRPQLTPSPVIVQPPEELPSDLS